LRKRLESEMLFTKVARYDTTKGWNEAVEAVAKLNWRGAKTTLLARGGMESYGEEVIYNARQAGLKVRDVTSSGNSMGDYLEAIDDDSKAEILNIRFHCPPELLRILYHASDAVLANSAHEPFGLVGLETMAAGGIAFTGCTGEDYAIHMHNAIVLETSAPEEIESYVTYLDHHEEKEEDIRREGPRTARRFIWKEVIKHIIERTEGQASIQGILRKPVRNHVAASGVNGLYYTMSLNKAAVPLTLG